MTRLRLLFLQKQNQSRSLLRTTPTVKFHHNRLQIRHRSLTPAACFPWTQTQHRWTAYMHQKLDLREVLRRVQKGRLRISRRLKICMHHKELHTLRNDPEVKSQKQRYKRWMTRLSGESRPKSERKKNARKRKTTRSGNAKVTPPSIAPLVSPKVQRTRSRSRHTSRKSRPLKALHKSRSKSDRATGTSDPIRRLPMGAHNQARDERRPSDLDADMISFISGCGIGKMQDTHFDTLTASKAQGFDSQKQCTGRCMGLAMSSAFFPKHRAISFHSCGWLRRSGHNRCIAHPFALRSCWRSG